MDKPIRFALIAYGKVARLHAKAIRTVAGAQLVAVYGRDPAKREAFASEFGIRAYGDIGEMVVKGEVDAVIVASPHPQHKEHAIAALKAGANVLVEKPMAIRVEDCEEMMESAAQAKRLLSVVCQRRWYPSVQRIRKAIDEGKLGAPALGQVLMLGWRDQAYYESDPWRGSWQHEGGGVLVNQAPHQLDLLLWLMGPAVEVSAYWENLNHPYIEVEDTAVASIRFASGALGSVLVSNSQKPGIYAKVHIHGRNGSSAGVQTDGGAMFIAGMSGVLEPPYNDIWTIPGEERHLTRWKEEDAELFAGIDATEYFHALQFSDFAQAIRTGTPPAVSGEDGRATVALIQAIYRSGRERRHIQL